MMYNVVVVKIEMDEKVVLTFIVSVRVESKFRTRRFHWRVMCHDGRATWMSEVWIERVLGETQG